MMLYITPNQNGFDCNLVKDGILQRRIQLEQMSLIELGDELESLLSDVFGNYEIKILGEW